MTITTIEKAAKLMGYDLSKVTGTHPHLGLFIDEGPEFRQWFNPYTNKADLVDVECALPGLEITIGTHHVDVQYFYDDSDIIGTAESYDDHPNEFTARAHAVMAVVEQIYDAKKDNL